MTPPDSGGLTMAELRRFLSQESIGILPKSNYSENLWNHWLKDVVIDD